jgi:hypothetical protein
MEAALTLGGWMLRDQTAFVSPEPGRIPWVRCHPQNVMDLRRRDALHRRRERLRSRSAELHLCQRDWIVAAVERDATQVVINDQRLVFKNLHQTFERMSDWGASATNLRRPSRESAGNFGKGSIHDFGRRLHA